MFHSPPLETYLSVRFGPHQLIRNNLIRALFHTIFGMQTQGDFRSAKIASRLHKRLNACCSSPVIVVDDEDDQVRISERRCKCRICPLCGKARARAVFIKILGLVSAMDAPKFITLTPISSNARLSEQIIELKESFKRLRRSKDWKERVLGGVYTLEITYNAKRRQWHPHLHLVVDSVYYPQQVLSSGWRIASCGASIVDIRACPSKSRIAQYIAGYVAKSSDISKFPERRRIEWAIETNGLRFVQTFGTSHRVRVDDDDEYSDDGEIITTELLDPTQLAYAETVGDKEAGELFALCLKLERRRVSHAPPGKAQELAAAIRDFTSRLRAWGNLHPEVNHRGSIEIAENSSRKRGLRDRPQWLWQEPSSSHYP